MSSCFWFNQTNSLCRFKEDQPVLYVIIYCCFVLNVPAYTDNEFDVAVLMEEADSKALALERVADLEDEVGRVNERLQELEVTCQKLKLT